jgi:Leucine-rich repeat (LRR) protein
LWRGKVVVVFPLAAGTVEFSPEKKRRKRKTKMSLDPSWSAARWLVVTVVVLVASPTAVQTFCPSMCQCDDSLLEASCSGSRLDSVPILLNPSLRSLHLAHNRIASLRQSVSFYGELRRLDLSHNVLHSLGLLHFQPLGQLEWLNVSNNLVSSLEMESFAGLRSLTVLDLSANRLTRLTDDLFVELPALVTLILSGNKIQTVAAGAFDSLRQLHTLRLEDNNLGHVPSAALAPLAASLRSLYLSKNLIETLEDGTFRHLARLRFLGLNDNAIDRVDPLAFDTLVSLDALDLSFNRLDGVVEAFTASLSPMTHLDLSGNLWRQLPANFLSGLPRLQTLNISYMEYLRSVDPAVFHVSRPAANGSLSSSVTSSSSTSLPVKVLPIVNLVMTNNALWNHLPLGVFHGLDAHLVRLDLSGNAFETLDMGRHHHSADWPHLNYLNVAYNPLQCNCSLLWLWNMLQQRNHSTAVSGGSPAVVVVNVTCSGPPPFSGLPLSSLNQSDLFCSLALPVSIIVLLVISWLVLVAGLVVLVIYWRRRRNARRESRLMIIKSSHHHHQYNHRDLSFQHHNGTSPILGGPVKHQQQYRVDSNSSPALSGHHHVGATIPHYYQHQHPNNLQHQHHHHFQPGQLAAPSARDEYTYHCAGTIKRIPVTVV